MSREEKLEILRGAGSIAGIEDWQEITPDRHHDWIGQRDEAFQEFYPMGSKAAKSGAVGSQAVFELYSNGLKSGKDSYLYSYSRDACAKNGRAMTDDYEGAMLALDEYSNDTIDDVVSRHSSNIRWDRELTNTLRRRKGVAFSKNNVRTIQYRPFVKQHCYVDFVFIQRKYQMDSIFPTEDSQNRAICVPGVGSTKPFSALAVDMMPDLHLVAFGQCFPKYRYVQRPGSDLYKQPSLERIDNISDSALAEFRAQYNDENISKDMIFDYVYGILHHSGYCKPFANDLAKDLPRIPFSPDFYTFAEAGKALAELHLGYETCEEYPLEIAFSQPGEPQPQHFRIGEQKMRFEDDEKSALRINEHVTVRGIPEAAHQYSVNGRTPLEWFIDRYKITQDKKSGIVNDPNGWFDDPGDLITAIRRVVHVSVETVRIIEDLPEPFGPVEGS